MTSNPRSRRKAVLGGTALGVAGALALAGPIAAAFAAGSGAPVVSTSETVKVNLDSSGKLDVARVFSQIEATGKGKVSLQDPTSTKGLRNLDGWGAPSTEDGKASYDFDVDGQKHFRTVADFTGKVPVDIEVTYKLDGKQIEPGDLAGRSGKLAVTYDVANNTSEPTDITFQDGHGKTVTESHDIVTPYVGQLVLDLPESFDNVRSTDNRADQAGNGHGGRLVTWTMVLFEPIGQVEQTFGFSADVKDAVLPAAHVQVVPVSPENHPELKFGQDGFSTGAKSGRDLTAGTTTIDENLLKLQDGASQLLTGLTQLQDGAIQLSTGLADGVPAAIDGSQQVADGAKQLSVGNRTLALGLGELGSGAGRLQAGGRQLADGADRLVLGFNNPDSDEDLIDGSQALAGALGLISGGLGQLNDAGSGLPAAKAGAVALQAGVNQILAGLGSATTPETILNGLALLSGGNAQLKGGVASLRTGADGLADPAAGLPAAKGGVDAVKSGLDDALAPGHAIDALKQAVGDARATVACSSDPVCKANLDGALAGIEGSPTSLREKTQAASAGLGQVSVGLATAIAGVGVGSSPGPLTLRGGLAQVAGGLDQSGVGLTKVTAGVNQVVAGLKSNSAAHPGISEGLAQLVAGLNTAVSGIGQLAPGAALANVGAGDLADGIAQAGDGAAQLQDGSNQLADGLDEVAAKVPDAVAGARKLATGSQKLADGSEELATGLGGLTEAQDGSAKIADGLGKARDGDEQIVDGAGRLSKEGTSELVKAGEAAAVSYGQEYATMQALNKKGAERGLPYGAPSGSKDNRGAYDITIAGVGHQGAGSATRGVAGLAILALGAGVATALRGRFA